MYRTENSRLSYNHVLWPEGLTGFTFKQLYIGVLRNIITFYSEMEQGMKRGGHGGWI